MTVVYKRPDALTKAPFSFCPGCTHSTVNKLIAECIDEYDLKGDAILITGVSCACFNFLNYDTDTHAAMHGRAPANATGIKRIHPDAFVFTYQGDGDLAAIGTAEIVHAAQRGEKITVFFVNNANYGMTGGQMAPTTLPGQRTTTTPYGRDPKGCGNPIRVSEMLATLDGAKFIERVALDTPANVRKAKKAFKRACECQMKDIGFSLVEILSTCPTNWGKSPVDALQWLRDNMIPYYPLGNFKDF